MLPAFIIWDSVKQDYREIRPGLNDEKIKLPEDFGDKWTFLKSIFSQLLPPLGFKQ